MGVAAAATVVRIKLGNRIKQLSPVPSIEFGALQVLRSEVRKNVHFHRVLAESDRPRRPCVSPCALAINIRVNLDCPAATAALAARCVSQTDDEPYSLRYSEAVRSGGRGGRTESNPDPPRGGEARWQQSYS
jgi:hypothetical protein